jgi:HK97 family phage prohead protease
MNKIFTKALASSFDDVEHTLACTMSAEVVDRHGEIVDIDSMNIDNFMLNPVVLQSHDYDKLAVGKVLSITKTVNEAGIKVMDCVIKFAVDEYEVAKTHWELYKGTYMSAFSIGFRVGAVQTDQETGVTRLMNCELLEISCVSVPANQLALAKSKGIDISSVLKHMPDKELQKALKDLLIEVKELMVIKDAPLDKETKTVILDKREAGKARAKLLVEQAIRQLKG